MAGTMSASDIADSTYIPTVEGWLCLAVLLDLFTRKVRRLPLPRPGICCQSGREFCRVYIEDPRQLAAMRSAGQVKGGRKPPVRGKRQGLKQLFLFSMM